MHYVTKEKAADEHFMVKVADRVVTETREKRQAEKLVSAIRGLRRMEKASKQVGAQASILNSGLSGRSVGTLKRCAFHPI